MSTATSLQATATSIDDVAVLDKLMEILDALNTMIMYADGVYNVIATIAILGFGALIVYLILKPIMYFLY